MLAYSNFVEMSCEKNLVFAIYDRVRTLKHDEMFACNWRKFLIHTCILKFCQDVLSEDAMSRSLWSCSHAKTWRDALFARNWRMSRSLISFVCFSSNEMSWQLIYISLSTCCTTYERIHKFWRDVLTNDLYLAVFDFVEFIDSCSHIQILTRRFNWQYVSQFAIVLAC